MVRTAYRFPSTVFRPATSGPHPDSGRIMICMTQDATELLKRALALTEEERAELAGSLLESLDDAHEDPEAVEAAWSEEIARRIEDLDSGQVKPVSLGQVLAGLSSAAE